MAPTKRTQKPETRILKLRFPHFIIVTFDKNGDFKPQPLKLKHGDLVFVNSPKNPNFSYKVTFEPLHKSGGGGGVTFHK